MLFDGVLSDLSAYFSLKRQSSFFPSLGQLPLIACDGPVIQEQQLFEGENGFFSVVGNCPYEGGALE
jgi:hypothetical protein